MRTKTFADTKKVWKDGTKFKDHWKDTHQLGLNDQPIVDCLEGGFDLGIFEEDLN